MNLGRLHEELGDMAEAEAAFRTALKLQPAFALPHARLATLLRHKLPDDDLAALEARLADDKLGAGPPRPTALRPGPRAGWAGRVRARRRLPAAGQRHHARAGARPQRFITRSNTSGLSTA